MKLQLRFELVGCEALAHWLHMDKGAVDELRMNLDMSLDGYDLAPVEVETGAHTAVVVVLETSALASVMEQELAALARAHDIEGKCQVRLTEHQFVALNGGRRLL